MNFNISNLILILVCIVLFSNGRNSLTYVLIHFLYNYFYYNIINILLLLNVFLYKTNKN